MKQYFTKYIIGKSPISGYISYRFSNLARPPKQSNIVLDEKYPFGQAGTMNSNLSNGNYDIYIQTIWEDYATVKIVNNSVNDKSSDLQFSSQDQGRQFYIDDNSNQTIPEQQQYTVFADLPEYFNYKIDVNGSIFHRSAEVDAQIYGDVQAYCKNGGVFESRQIKSEQCSIQTDTGDINISGYLEAQNLRLETISGQVKIKRISITNRGCFQLNNSKTIEILSMYSDKPIEQYIPKKLSEKDIDEVLNGSTLYYDKVSNLIRKRPHNVINIINSEQCNFGNFHGNFQINCEQASNFSLSRVSAEQFTVNIQQTQCAKLNLVKLEFDSFVCVTEGLLDISIQNNFPVNIYDCNKQKLIYEGQKSQSSFFTPTLFLQSNNIQISHMEAQDIFTKLENYQRKRQKRLQEQQ